MRHHHQTTAAALLGVTFLSLTLLTCDRQLGSNPIGSPIDDNDITVIDPDTGLPPDSVAENMSISVSPNPVAASDLSVQATVTIHVFDSRHNPLSGREVRFRADAGLIYPVDTTDEAGVAKVPFFSDQYNGTARVYAQTMIDNKTVTVSRTIVQTGVSIEIDPARTVTILDDTVLVLIRVLDGTGSAVGNAVLSIRGAIDTSGRTASDGTCYTRAFTRASKGDTVTITVAAAGASNSRDIVFLKTLSDGTTGTDDRATFMRIFSAATQLKADNSDKTTITVLLLNDADLRNPAEGERIRFQTTLGSITQEAVVDSTGRAYAILRSEPTNGTALITATSVSGSITASTSVVFGGVRVELSSDRIAQEITKPVVFKAVVRDGSDNLIGNQSITFFLDASSVGTFANGQRTYTTTLDPTGAADAVVTSGSSGYSIVNALSLNTSDSLSVMFTTNRLTMTTSKPKIAVGGSATAVITATYVDGSRKPVEGEVIQFATNAGTLSATFDTTNSQGKASTKLHSANFAGTATIEARTSGGAARIQVEFTAGIPATIELTVSPDNIPIVTGAATLKALVRDVNGNLVNGTDVNFRILAGPGDKEHVENPLATTNNGVAYNTIYAGKVPSNYRSVEILAEIGTISARTKLTISGEPYLVTVSVPEDDTVKVPEGGVLNESTFGMYVGAVVQDINGNPVANGTEVHFSAVVSGMSVAVKRFVRWDFSGTDIKPVIEYRTRDIPFEDVNNNLKMDEGIDLNLDYNDLVAARGDDVNGDGQVDYDGSIHDFYWDYNLNGRCDPGVSEPAFEITYKRESTAIDTSVDTTTTLADRPRYEYDTSVVLGLDTLIVYDTAIAIGPDTAIVYDTLVHSTSDSTVIYDTSVTLAYVTDTVTDTTVVMQYVWNEIVDTTIATYEDTVLMSYDTVAAGTVCDTTKDTNATMIYLVTCYNDTIHVINELRQVSDTAIAIVNDTTGVRYDTTYAIAIHTVGTRPDTSIVVRYNVQQRRDTTINLVYDISQIIDTSIAVQRNIFTTRDTLIALTTHYDKYIDTTITVTYDTTWQITDSSATIYADLNGNGVWDKSELYSDNNNNGVCDLPASGDFRFSLWETRPYWQGSRFDFNTNEFAVVIDASAVVEEGVAKTRLTFPRQLARRLFVTVNAEANGKRDSDGQRVLLPVLRN